MNVGKSCLSAVLMVSMGVIGSFIPFIAVSNANSTSTAATPQTSKTNPAPANATDLKAPTPSPATPGAIANPQPSANIPLPDAATKRVATHLVLDLTQRRVTAYKNEEVLGSYPVAVGKKGWETPTGSFKVLQKIKNPTWQNPWNGKIMPAGPNTALGERWIGFWTNGKDTIGFHGTPTVDSIGKAASHGCVRMYNKDVIELFEVVSVGTPVTVK
jgi:lipoprotein-anchoring transpeptidase ErfK/SrfK